MERPSLKLVPGNHSRARYLTAKEQADASDYAVASPGIMIRSITAEIRWKAIPTGTKASETVI